MEIKNELFYSRTHEWIKFEGNTATVGITDYAQDNLGDIVFVELPECDSSLVKGDECGVIESVKAVSDLYSPISGKVIEINEKLDDEAEFINEEPYEAWIYKLEISNVEEKNELMNASDYATFCEEEA